MSSNFFLKVLVFSIGFSDELIAQRISETRNKLGSPFSITIESNNPTNAKNAVGYSFRLVDSLNLIFSDYLPESELSKLNLAKQNSILHLSYDMFYLLHKSQEACRLSNGAFDITSGKITHHWRKAIKNNSPIVDDSLNHYKKYCGCEVYFLDTLNKTLIKKNDKFSFDVGGIAKGYIAQCVSDFLRGDFPMHMVDAGGDIVLGDPPSGGNGWKIGVEKDQECNHIVELKNQAIATSGATYQYLEIKNKKYSHIIDPKSAKGVTNRKNISIIAAKGEDADWLATACSILSNKKAKKLLKKFNAVQI